MLYPLGVCVLYQFAAPMVQWRVRSRAPRTRASAQSTESLSLRAQRLRDSETLFCVQSTPWRGGPTGIRGMPDERGDDVPRSARVHKHHKGPPGRDLPPAALGFPLEWLRIAYRFLLLLSRLFLFLDLPFCVFSLFGKHTRIKSLNSSKSLFS